MLDLGPASTDKLALFGAFRCRIWVEDLWDDLPPPAAPDEERRPLRLTTVPRDAAVDLVLAWDFFNYLDPDRLGDLGTEIARRCRDGALLVAFVHTRKEMPLHPQPFRITADGSILHPPLDGPGRPAPAYKEPDLLRRLPGFEVDSSLLLRTGLQEYVFVYRASGDPNRTVATGA